MSFLTKLTSSKAPCVLGAVFLLIVGAGAWSLDAIMSKSAGPHRNGERLPREEKP